MPASKLPDDALLLIPQSDPAQSVDRIFTPHVPHGTGDCDGNRGNKCRAEVPWGPATGGDAMYDSQLDVRGAKSEGTLD
jgi:hypothetical protein